MTDPNLDLALTKLRQLHSALDKIGCDVFPHKNSKDMVGQVLQQIALVHEELDRHILDNADIRVLERINSTILEIIKTTIKESRSITDQARLDKFNELVKDFMTQAMETGQVEVDSGALAEYKYKTIAEGEDNPRSWLGEITYLTEHNEQHGLFIEWHDSGAVKTIGLYDHGKPAGLWTSFDKDGNLTLQFDHTKAAKAKEAEAQRQEIIKKAQERRAKETLREKFEKLGFLKKDEGNELIGQLDLFGDKGELNINTDEQTQTYRDQQKQTARDMLKSFGRENEDRILADDLIERFLEREYDLDEAMAYLRGYSRRAQINIDDIFERYRDILKKQQAQQRVEGFKKNISVAQLDEKEGDEVFKDHSFEDPGFGSVIAGSLAALTLTTLFGHKKKTKKTKGLEQHKQVEQIEVAQRR